LAAIVVESELRDGEDASMAQPLHAAVCRTEQILKGLLGELGARALLARASHLARRASGQGAILSAAGAPSVMELAHWQHVATQQGDARARDEAEKLLEHAIVLLCDFIGRDLTFRVFKRSYPAFRTEDSGRDPSEGQGV
jgi:hypothetical protein